MPQPAEIAGAAAEDRRMRVVAILLICATTVCFTAHDTATKWLGARLPSVEIVWVRYLTAGIVALVATRAWSRPAVLRANRPGLQTLRSALLAGSSVVVVVSLHRLQLAEVATIGFLSPIFVAMLAAPFLGERVGPDQALAMGLGLVGVLIATHPGTGAFQPIVLLAVLGVVFNAGYVIATRKLARFDRAQTTLVWTQIAGVVVLTPMLPWVWRWPESTLAWLVLGSLGLFGAGGHALLIVAHKYAPAPALAPFFYVQLIWTMISGVLVFGDWPRAPTLIGAALVAVSGLFLALRERSRGRRLDALSAKPPI